MNVVRAARLEKGATDECLRCFYCDGLLAPSHEHDHFPRPKAAGGTQVVSACSNCHDLKDRTRLADYPMAELWTGAWELIRFYRGELTPQTSPQDLIAGLREEDVLRAWQSLSVDARIVYGKLVSIEYHGRM